MADTVSIKVKVVNRLGLHARPAMAFVDLAATFAASIWVVKGDTRVDGKSIMQMMMLAATQGTELEIVARSEDCDEAIAELVALVKSKFQED